MRLSRNYTEEELVEIVRKQIVTVSRGLNGPEVVAISSRTNFPVLKVLEIAKREKEIIG